MDFTKGIALVQSKTFWGALLALVAIVAQQFGLSGLFKWAANPSTVDTILAMVAMASSVFAMVGRSVATQPVTSILPPKKD